MQVLNKQNTDQQIFTKQRQKQSLSIPVPDPQRSSVTCVSMVCVPLSLYLSAGQYKLMLLGTEAPV